MAPGSLTRRPELLIGPVRCRSGSAGAVPLPDCAGLPLLVVEDDPDLRSRADPRPAARRASRSTASATARELIERMRATPPDALVVDIGLPDADGRDVCQALRARGVDAPVLFLTARDALTDRLAGFAAGGDDYLDQAVRTSTSSSPACARSLRRSGADLAADGRRPAPRPGRARARRAADVDVDLTPTEFRLLAALAGAPGDVVRRRELVRAGWPHGAIVHDNTLDRTSPGCAASSRAPRRARDRDRARGRLLARDEAPGAGCAAGSCSRWSSALAAGRRC